MSKLATISCLFLSVSEHGLLKAGMSKHETFLLQLFALALLVAQFNCISYP